VLCFVWHGVLFCVICVFLCAVSYCSTTALGKDSLQFNYILIIIIINNTVSISMSFPSLRKHSFMALPPFMCIYIKRFNQFDIFREI
jgi:hypothetical protein